MKIFSLILRLNEQKCTPTKHWLQQTLTQSIFPPLETGWESLSCSGWKKSRSRETWLQPYQYLKGFLIRDFLPRQTVIQSQGMFFNWFRLDGRKTSFTQRPWHRWPRDAVDSPSVECPRPGWMAPLENQSHGWQPCPWKESWNEVILKIHCNRNHTMILWKQQGIRYLEAGKRGDFLSGVWLGCCF